MSGLTKTSEILKKEFEKKLQKNKNYSQRSFAAYLNITSGRLSELINNKRNITKQTALTISKKLNLTEKEIEDWVYSLRNRKNYQK